MITYSSTTAITLRTGTLTHTILLTTVLVALGLLTSVRASSTYIRCGECDEARCPELHYCEGQAIKDHCGCCTVCSSPKFQPHPMIAPAGNACEQVQCPKRKVCVQNQQGLPLCTCPNLFVCRRTKKREVCGTDGRTYESRCHMRIASCNQEMVVRKKKRGPCTKEDEEESAASYRKKLNRMKRRKRRRRRRKNEDQVDTDTEEERREKRRRKEGKRKRRKSGLKKNRRKSRVRRHRRRSQAGKSFEEAFAHYTWKA